ncbi:MAG: response regulator [bacterium]|nr:response regulator [bacterium]
MKKKNNTPPTKRELCPPPSKDVAASSDGRDQIDSPDESGHPPGARILLAEDDEINRQMIGELLEYQGYRVSDAGDGREAVRILAECSKDNPFDLVLMDFQMPNLNGIEATKLIREIPHLNDLPIIALTADATAAVRKEMLEAGMNEYIAKPIGPVELFAVIAKWIGGRGTVEKIRETPAEPLQGEEEFKLLADIDLKAFLSASSDSELLWKLLFHFRDEYGNFVDKFNALYRAGDTEAAQRLAHSLKGAAGCIRAMGIHKTAANLQAAVEEAEKAEVIRILETLHVQLERCIASIKKEKWGQAK